MRITHIAIENFKAIDFLDYSPSKINIIVGRNNTGKTSLLEAISIAFDDEIIREKYRYVTGGPSSIINFGGNSGSIRLKFSGGPRDDLVATFSRPTGKQIVGHTIELLKSGVRQLEDIIKRSRPRKLVKGESSETSKKERQEHLDPNLLSEDSVEKLIGPQRLVRLIDESLKVTRGQISNTFYGPYSQGISGELINELIPKFPDRFRKELKEFPTSFFFNRSLHYYMYGDERDYPIDESDEKSDPSMRHHRNTKPLLIRDPLQMINKITRNREQVQNIAFQIDQIIKEDKLVPRLERFSFDSLVFTGVNRDVPMENMGDGFRVLIGLLGGLLMQPKSSILLLEEPEVHMHPGYLKELASYLVTLSRTRTLQLFISTHSLDLIQDFLDIESIRKEDQKYLQSELSIVRLNKSHDSTILEREDFSRSVESLDELEIDLRGI